MEGVVGHGRTACDVGEGGRSGWRGVEGDEGQRLLYGGRCRRG